MAKGEFVWGILFGRTFTRSSPNASTICTIPSSAPLIYDTNSAGAIDMGYLLVASAAEHEQKIVLKVPYFFVEVSFAGSIPRQRPGGAVVEYTLPTTAFVLKEVVAGRQPGDMIPQLPRVLPGRHRSDDRPKETALTIDRECWHTKSLQPFDTVLVLREDFFFHPWLGCGLGAPSRIESRLTQGTLNHLWITERFL